MMPSSPAVNVTMRVAWMFSRKMKMRLSRLVCPRDHNLPHYTQVHFKTLQRVTSERFDHDMENTGLICELKPQANIKSF